MVIWLASYPRSGNTFFRLAVHYLYGLRTHSVYADRQVGKVAEIVGHAPMDGPLEALEAEPEAHFVKTHELPGRDAYPAVYLVRDGRDVLVSYAHYVLSFEQDDPSRQTDEAFRHTLHDLIRYDASFGGWGPNVSAWLERPNTAIVRFEQMIADPVGSVRQALAAIGQEPASDGQARPMPSFEELHARLPQFFRKGQVGSWRTEMPDELHELFWERHGGVMRRLGYER